MFDKPTIIIYFNFLKLLTFQGISNRIMGRMNFKEGDFLCHL